MATLSGVWVFRDAPNLYVYNSDGYIWQNNLFATSNGKDIRTMQITETDQTISYATKEGWFDIYVDNKWVDEAYKILDFGEREVLVSDEFYTWFTANASNGLAEPIKQYLILEDSLKHIADGFRSSRGTTQEYTLSEMAAMAAEPVPTPKIEPLIVTENGTYDVLDFVDGYGPVTVKVASSGGASMFASTARGAIPEYEKGTALSEFTLDFESSAVGALQEG